MTVRLTLAKKLIGILILTLALELLLLGSLNYCRQEYQDEITSLFAAKRVNDVVKVIESELAELDAIMNVRGFTPLFVRSLNLTAVTRWQRYYEALGEAVKGNVNEERAVEKSHQAIKDAFSALTSLQAHPLVLENANTRKYWVTRLASLGAQARSPELLAINEKSKVIVERSPQVQEEIQTKEKAILLFGVFLNLTISLLFGFLFVRQISGRLNIVAENSRRLASGLPLTAAIRGDDEIMELDRVFRKMAQTLSESARKERAVVENARDVICSIDEDGKFVACNAASQAVLGIDSKEIIGRRYISLCDKDDAHRLLATVETGMKGEEMLPFEVRMTRGNGEQVDTLWTVSWSTLDKTLFCVIHDDSERKQAERMKQEVVAMITHDLRTPVATLRNVLEMLSADMFGKLDERGKGMLKVADTSTAQMLSLINDLLDIEKIKAGMLELDLSDVALKEVLNATCNALQPAAKERQISIEVKPNESVVIADEERLSRVVTNLVANALKFSPPKSTITVFAEAQDGFCRVAIQDQGRGIPEELLPTIFDRFTQVKNSDARSKGGSGLGLSICKALVELHGGNI